MNEPEELPESYDDKAIELMAKQGLDALRRCRPELDRFASDVKVSESLLDGDTYWAAWELKSFMFYRGEAFIQLLRYTRQPEGKTADGRTRKQVMEKLLGVVGAKKLYAEDKSFMKTRFLDLIHPDANPWPELQRRRLDLDRRLKAYIQFDSAEGVNFGPIEEPKYEVVKDP